MIMVQKLEYKHTNIHNTLLILDKSEGIVKMISNEITNGKSEEKEQYKHSHSHTRIRTNINITKHQIPVIYTLC